MSYAFITGVPTAGKSYLAARVAKLLDIQHIDTDAYRQEIRNDPALATWVDFFLNKDEEEYWRTTDCEAHWNNLKGQAEAFWPAMKGKMDEVIASGKSAIFEGVTLWPHLIRNDFAFGGIVLIGESHDQTFARNTEVPRWGKTRELQVIEADRIWNCERLKYREEAAAHGFKTFDNSMAAEKELLRMLK